MSLGTKFINAISRVFGLQQGGYVAPDQICMVHPGEMWLDGKPTSAEYLADLIASRPKTDPFWHTHTPPPYCGCERTLYQVDKVGKVSIVSPQPARDLTEKIEEMRAAVHAALSLVPHLEPLNGSHQAQKVALLYQLNAAAGRGHP